MVRLLKIFSSKVAGVVLLHQFVKKSEKTPLNEPKIARNRMKEVKDEKHS